MIGQIVVILIMIAVFAAYIYFANQAFTNIENAKLNLTYDMGYAHGVGDCNNVWINTISTYGSGGAIP